MNDTSKTLVLDCASVVEVRKYYVADSRRMADVVITDGHLVLLDTAEIADLTVVPA